MPSHSRTKTRHNYASPLRRTGLSGAREPRAPAVRLYELNGLSNSLLRFRDFDSIRAFIVNLAQLGFVRSLLRRDDIFERIRENHVRLTYCLDLFQVSGFNTF